MDGHRDQPPVVSTLRRGPEVMRLVEAFARALPGLSDAVLSSAVHGDLPATAAAAHRLKGSAGGYGFLSVHELAAAIERAAHDRDPVRCRVLARNLAGVCRRVRAGTTEGGRERP
jgi:hypothetical protein